MSAGTVVLTVKAEDREHQLVARAELETAIGKRLEVKPESEDENLLVAMLEYLKGEKAAGL